MGTLNLSVPAPADAEQFMFAVLTFALSCLVLLIPSGLIASRLFRREPLAASLMYLALFLVEITVIQLVLGIFNQLTTIALLLGAILLGGLLLAFRQAISQFWSIPAEAVVPSPQLNRSGILLVGFGALLLFSPLLALIAELVQQIFRVHPLSWDVVSYHLPNVLDYLQTGSLWTTRGEYSYYPGNNELIQIWSFLPLKQDLLLGINTATIGLGVFLASTLILNPLLADQSPFLRGLQVVALWAGCFSILASQGILFDFGRNDLTAAFWALVALWCLQQSLRQDFRRSAWFLAAGVSLGMLVGTKPYGVYYAIGLIGLALLPQVLPPNPSLKYRSEFIPRLLCLGVPLVGLAGFWYLRNVLKTGRVFSDELVASGVQYSILRNLTNPEFYRLNFNLFFFGLAIAIAVVSLLLWRLRPDRCSSAFRLTAGFQAIALTALILTPFGSGYPAGEQFIYTVQLRFGTAIVPVTLILALFWLSRLLGWAVPKSVYLTRLRSSIAALQGEATPISSLKFLVGISVLGAMLLAMQFATYQPPIGLPGFDAIVFSGNAQPSQVYAWVQKNIHNAHIYSLGLRPYGLHGFPFSNQVAYDLSSSYWKSDGGLVAIQQFQPNFIAIGLDPFQQTISPDLVRLIQQSQAMKLVYQDDLAAVLQVIDLNKLAK